MTIKKIKNKSEIKSLTKAEKDELYKEFKVSLKKEKEANAERQMDWNGLIDDEPI